MNKRNLKASFASKKMKWRRFFIGCFRPCAWRVVGVGRYFLNYIYTRCGKIQDLYFSTPIYKKLEKPMPTRQPVKFSIVRLCFYSWLVSVNQRDIISSAFLLLLFGGFVQNLSTRFFLLFLHLFHTLACLCEKHTYVLVRMYLCLSLNVLAFWFKRLCVSQQRHLHFRKELRVLLFSTIGKVCRRLYLCFF